MKESIFLTSFFSNHCSGSKFLTSAAILVENCVVSKREILETPLRPSQRPFHVSSVPVPSAVTNPTPVTTTLLFCKFKTSYFLLRLRASYYGFAPSRSRSARACAPLYY